MEHLHLSLPSCRPLISGQLVARGDPRTGSEQAVLKEARGGARGGNKCYASLCTGHSGSWCGDSIISLTSSQNPVKPL